MSAYSRSPAIRLLLIPFLVYLAWVLEIFLLAGNNRLLGHPDPAGTGVYTIIGCIFTGIVIPVLCIRRAFISGAVNMFQIGFRPVRRTILACSVTLGFGLAVLLLFNPFGSDRVAFARAFLLLLPTAIASVMVCWALAGTHIQASVRQGGVLVSITSGMVVSSLMFAAAALAWNPSLWQQGPLFWPVCAGLGTALFFFAVRDVYATALVAAGSGVFFSAGMFDPLYLHGSDPGIWIWSLVAVLVLVSIHFYLSRNFATLLLPPDHPPGSGRT